MNHSIYRISLDIHDISAPIALRLKSEDTQRQIRATLMEKGLPYDITDDCSAAFTAQLPDGTVVREDCAIEDNTIIYNMSEQVSAADGKVDCEFVLTDTASNRLTSPRFCLLVDPSIGGGQA